MERINKSIGKFLAVALSLSFGFPLGIVGIVFGATRGWTALLVVGIVLVVAGFYVMPLMWIKVGEKKQLRALLMLIENDYIYTVQELATQSNRKEDNVRTMIRKLIESSCLTGFLFKDDALILNDNVKQQKVREKKVCECCGAAMEDDGTRYVCAYCGNIVAE